MNYITPTTITPTMAYRSYSGETLSVCTDCGIPVIDQDAHNRLHSVMSYWAWAIATLKTNKASPDRYEIAWRIWRWKAMQDDLVKWTSPGDSRNNWFRVADSLLSANNRAERDACLKLADELIGIIGNDHGQ